MGSTETTAAPGTDNPQRAEQRTCRDCGETKVVQPETWPYRSPGKGKPYKVHGQRCTACETIRKDKHRKRLAGIVAAVGTESPEPPKGQAADKGKADTADKSQEKKPGKLDISKALKTGAIALNDYAASVMARVLEYADDPLHEHHLWALELLAQRVLPRKLFEELGGQAAGLGSLQDKRPVYLIQVLPAQPNQPAGRVIPSTGEVETVEILPPTQQLTAPQ